MREEDGNENEVRDLFIRLQAGTPLTAQEKRDAWPGDFTVFVIRHAGRRKFFAGLAMTIMCRARPDTDISFVDLNGKTINEFYTGNLELKHDNPAALRVIRIFVRNLYAGRVEVANKDSKSA